MSATPAKCGNSSRAGARSGAWYRGRPRPPLHYFGIVTLADGTGEDYGINMGRFRWAQTANYGTLPNAALPKTFVALKPSTLVTHGAQSAVASTARSLARTTRAAASPIPCHSVPTAWGITAESGRRLAHWTRCTSDRCTHATSDRWGSDWHSVSTRPASMLCPMLCPRSSTRAARTGTKIANVELVPGVAYSPTTDYDYFLDDY